MFEMFVLVLMMINDYKHLMIILVHLEEKHVFAIINIYYNQLNYLKLYYDEILMVNLK